MRDDDARRGHDDARLRGLHDDDLALRRLHLHHGDWMHPPLLLGLPGREATVAGIVLLLRTCRTGHGHRSAEDEGDQRSLHGWISAG